MKRIRLSPALAAPLALAALLGLSGCDTSLRPPGDTGVCYHYVTPKGEKPRFNVLAKNVPSLEACAAKLEGMRMRFLMLGGAQTNITGAYQSKFLFLESAGIFTADSLDGASYIALVRTGDGKLAPPGAFKQP
jgi:hypothetical protein